MSYLHGFEPPIVHRDLKSLNLLLANPVETVHDLVRTKVGDFGLSKVAASQGPASMTKNAGTFHWMAPEVFCSDSYDRKVDVYSFSMILYEVICQNIPFEQVHPKRLGLHVIKGLR